MVNHKAEDDTHVSPLGDTLEGRDTFVPEVLSTERSTWVSPSNLSSLIERLPNIIN